MKFSRPKGVALLSEDRAIVRFRMAPFRILFRCDRLSMVTDVFGLTSQSGYKYQAYTSSYKSRQLVTPVAKISRYISHRSLKEEVARNCVFGVVRIARCERSIY